MAALATPDAATVDATEAVRLRVEQVLAAEQVNLTSLKGREHAGRIIDQEIDTYHAETLNGRAAQLSSTTAPRSHARCATTSSASARSPSRCSPTPRRRSG